MRRAHAWKDPGTGEPCFLAQGDSEHCSICDRHISRHYGLGEYRCYERIDPDVPLVIWPGKIPTDFRKHDTDKPRLDLIPRAALEAAGRALGNGAVKYGANNWRTCKEPERYVAATLRHIVAWNEGEATDPESGLSHLDHAAASLAILIGLVTQEKKP